MIKGWINKETGAIRVFVQGEELDGFSQETHDLIDVDESVLDGNHDWDADTRTFVLVSVDPVPTSVTPLQMRKAIRHSGLKPLVEAFLAGADDEIVEAWEYATLIERSNEFVGACMVAMGKTDQECDDLFRLAATL